MKNFYTLPCTIGSSNSELSLQSSLCKIDIIIENLLKGWLFDHPCGFQTHCFQPGLSPWWGQNNNHRVRNNTRGIESCKGNPNAWWTYQPIGLCGSSWWMVTLIYTLLFFFFTSKSSFPHTYLVGLDPTTLNIHFRELEY